MKAINDILTDFLAECKHLSNETPRTIGTVTTYNGKTYNNLTFDQIRDLSLSVETWMQSTYKEIQRYMDWLQGYNRTPYASDYLRWMRERMKAA